MSLRLRVSILALLTLCCAPASIKAGNAPVSRKVWLVAERHSLVGREQSALIFEGDSVELTANSDFLQAADQPAVLGLFKNPEGEESKKIHAQLEQLLREVEQAPPSKVKSSPHALKIFLGPRELGPGSSAYEHAIQILEKAFLLHWTPVNAVRVSRNASGEVEKLERLGETSRSSTEKASPEYQCDQMRQSCKIEGFGHVHLKERDQKR